MELTTEKKRCGRCALIGAFVGSDLRTLYQRAWRNLTRQEIAYVAHREYQVPDSAVCVAALDLVTSVSPPFLVNHSLRAHAFGCALAYKAERSVDRELFFLGSIMHDLGLTETYDTGAPFELDGARAAREFCVAHGVGSEGADLVHEMVALHDAVGVAHKREPEIALLHFGAGLDVAGLFADAVHPVTLREVLDKYPGLGFRESFAKLIEDQTRRKPDCYIAGMAGLGFTKKIRTQSPVVD